MFTLKPMKLKAAVELDILRCVYSRQLVNSILFAIGMPTLVNELEVCSSLFAYFL